MTGRPILGDVAAESLTGVGLGAIVAAASALPVLFVMLLGVTGLIGWFPVSLPWAPVGAVTAACAVIGVLAVVITSARAMRGPASSPAPRIQAAGLRPRATSAAGHSPGRPRFARVRFLQEAPRVAMNASGDGTIPLPVGWALGCAPPGHGRSRAADHMDSHARCLLAAKAASSWALAMVKISSLVSFTPN